MSTSVSPPPGGKQEDSVALMSKVPLGAIIGGPLTAAVEAQAAAAIACASFIKNVGLTTDANGKVSLNEVTFAFEHQPAVAPGSPPPQAQSMKVTVPLLSMLPIPFIRIESLTASFKIAISAIDERSNQEKSTLDAEGKLDASVGFALWKVGASGSVSSKKDSTATNTSKYSVEQTMDISLHAVQDDMPVGLARLLDLLKDEIKMIPA
jgi:hypothetical protein